MPVDRDLDAFLSFRLNEWRGLPDIALHDLVAVFGTPKNAVAVELGYYPATRSEFTSQTESGGFFAYSRELTGVVMIETLKQPGVSVLSSLPEPMGILPNELLLEGAYAHEYVYGERGLVLTVAVPHGWKHRQAIVRARGFAPIASIREFGAELYRPFEDRIVYHGPIGGAS